MNETRTPAEIVTAVTGLRSGPYFNHLTANSVPDLLRWEAASADSRKRFEELSKSQLIGKLTKAGSQDLYYRQLTRRSKTELVTLVWNKRTRTLANAFAAQS